MDRVPKRLWLVGQSIYLVPDAIAANAGACGIVSDVSLSGLTAGALTIAAQPDYPRNLRIFITDANTSLEGAVVTITGKNARGEVIVEAVTFTVGGTQNKYTSNAFAKVTSAVITTTGTVTATDDKVAIGIGNKLGLFLPPGAILDSIIKCTYDEADEDGTVDLTYGTYLPAGTLDASDQVEVSYLYSVAIDSF